ncbi:hypothetical protein T265_14892, partial [Opisthorchis viverrini]
SIIDGVDVRIPEGVSTSRPSGRPKKRLTEQHLRTRANVYRALGQFGLNLLQRGGECIKENPKLLNRKRDVAFSDQAKDFGSMFQLSLRSFLRQLVESDLSEAGSSTLSADTDNTEDSRSPAPPTSVEVYVDMLATCPTTYESAVPVFRMISHCLNQAEQYYTISEHCSDAVALGQQRSKAYLLMSGFESSEARQIEFTSLVKSSPFKNRFFVRLFVLMCVSVIDRLIVIPCGTVVPDNVPHVSFSAAKDFGSMFQLSLRSFLRQLVESDLSEAGSSTLSADTDNTEDSRSPAPPTSVEVYVDMLATCPTTYESAVPVFRMISHCLNQAEQYYTISEHCSDAVALGQQRSKAYLLMSGFESSEARQCCMHKRRVDVLETILRPLSRKHYLMLCRQLMFELAEALTTMRDLKQRAYEEVRQAKTESALHYARKANSLAKRALAFYQQLINSYARPNQLCHTLSEDEIRPLMLAHFYSARLHSKLFPATREDRVQNLSKALSQYNYVVSLVEAHLRHNPESTIGQSEEVQIARDMAHLLPTKITRLHRGERLAD